MEEFDPDVGIELYDQAQLNFTNSRVKINEQMDIEKNMLKYGMIVDKEERKIVKYDISEGRWSYDPWGLEWKWEVQLPDELFTWSINDTSPESWQ